MLLQHLKFPTSWLISYAFCCLDFKVGLRKIDFGTVESQDVSRMLGSGECVLEGLYHFSIYHLSHHFLCFFLKAKVCRNFESFPTTKQEPSLLFNLTKNLEHVYEDTLLFYFFGHTLQHAGSQLPNQGLNPCPMHWDHGILIPGHQEVSRHTIIITVLSHSVMSNSFRPHGPQPARLLCPWGFSRQEYWSGLTNLPPGDLPNPGIEPRSPELQTSS